MRHHKFSKIFSAPLFLICSAPNAAICNSKPQWAFLASGRLVAATSDASHVSTGLWRFSSCTSPCASARMHLLFERVLVKTCSKARTLLRSMCSCSARDTCCLSSWQQSQGSGSAALWVVAVCSGVRLRWSRGLRAWRCTPPHSSESQGCQCLQPACTIVLSGML